MSSLPAWAKWPIIVGGMLLSPVLAFLFALSVAVLVVVIKEAGVAVSLTVGGAGTIAYLGVRRLRGVLRGGLGT